MPIPVSNTVTTQQIVRTMKRGENGVSSVSQTFAIAYSPVAADYFAAAYIIRLRCYGKMAGVVTALRTLFALQRSVFPAVASTSTAVILRCSPTWASLEGRPKDS